MPVPSLYFPARYAAKSKPTLLTTLPEVDFDDLSTLESQRPRQLADIAAHNESDAAYIAQHSLLIEGGNLNKPSRNETFRSVRHATNPNRP